MLHDTIIHGDVTTTCSLCGFWDDDTNMCIIDDKPVVDCNVNCRNGCFYDEAYYFSNDKAFRALAVRNMKAKINK